MCLSYFQIMIYAYGFCKDSRVKMLRSAYLKRVESNLANVLVYDSLEVEIVESDVELDDSDVVEPDYDPPQQVSD